MTFRYLLNGMEIVGAFKDADGTSYPSNWLELATADDLERVGIMREEIVPPPEPPSVMLGNQKCFSDVDIDREVVRQIYELVAPSRPADLQSSAEKALIAKVTYLTVKKTMGMELSDDELAELTAAMQLWASIGAIRTAGNVANAELTALLNPPA